MTVKVTLSRAASRSDIGDTLPITFGQPDLSEDIAADTTNKLSTMAIATDTQQIWEIHPDVDIRVAFGKTPDAKGTTTRFLAAGIPRTFGVRTVGEKVAITTAS